MATIAGSVPRVRTFRLRPVLGVVALCLGAAALYGWMRIPLGNAEFEAFRGWCTRIEMAPGDWPCATGQAYIVVALVASSLLTGLALAVPGLVLAASGRRLTSLIPVTLGAVATGVGAMLSPSGDERLFGVDQSLIGSGDPGGYWFAHPVLAAVMDLVLVSVPAIAIVLLVPPARRPRRIEIRRRASWVATFAVVGTIAIFRMALVRVPGEELFVPATSFTLIATGTMALFGAMLGTDRRWWPWALVPAALFLSLGPTMAVASIPTTLTALTWFASVLPLAVCGFIGSLWRPIAERLSGVRVVRPLTVTSARTVRPTAVLNAVAVALLVVSLLAARYDPLPVQIATPLPTLLGARVHAQDARTMTNLSEAIDVAQSYREANGTFDGFDAAAGELAAPAFRWLDRVTHQPLVLTVASAEEDSVRFLAQSASGPMFCMQRADEGVTYGAAEQRPPSVADPTLAERAMQACGSTPFTPRALAMFDVGAMCDGADDQVILLCRSVQKLIRETLASPTVN
jgi:hypothetical protein